MSTETTAKAEKPAAKPPVKPATPEPAAAEPEVKPVPKSKLSWRERLAQMDPEEAAKVRAKAAEASRISKAKAKGTTPQIAAAMRLKTRLSANIERTELLQAERAAIEAELAAIEAQLAAEHTPVETEAGDGEV